MMKVERVYDFKPVICQIYRTEDHSFLYGCHKAASGLAECVEDMCNTISENAEFYAVHFGRETIGFFVKTPCDGQIVLEGFHVKKEFRTFSVFRVFWKFVRLYMGKDFWVGILETNKPAINHLIRNGFHIKGSMESQGKKFNLLHNKLF